MSLCPVKPKRNTYTERLDADTKHVCSTIFLTQTKTFRLHVFGIRGGACGCIFEASQAVE